MKQKWTEKPVTWGGCAALCVVCYIISMVGYTCYYIAWFRPTWATNLKETIKRRFKKITNKE